MNKKKIVSSMIFLAGFVILAFPFISQYVYRQAAKVENTTFMSEIKKIDTTEIERRIALAHAYNAALSGQSQSVDDPYSTQQQKEGLAEYARMLEVNEQIGIVTLPKIKEELPIYAGTEENVLQKGAGHMEGTSLPVGGTSTHAVITAHRGLPTAKLFTNLDQMEVGDTFFVKNIKETLAYEVRAIEIVEPTDLDAIAIESDKDRVTLLTCTPYMINSHRLLVHAERIPYEEIEPGKENEQKGPNLFKFWIIGISVILFLLLIRKKRR